MDYARRHGSPLQHRFLYVSPHHKATISANISTPE
jgi:hypothetical protein